MRSSCKLRKDSIIRIVRNGNVVWEGSLSSLQVDDADVGSATQWLECVIRLDGTFDVQLGDFVEAYAA